MHQASAANVQVRYARTAGFVYLLLIVLFMGGQWLISHVAGSGDFAERLQHITAGQWTYRVGLLLELLASVFTVVLAYALYVVLRPVHERLAGLALCFRLGEAFSGLLTFTSFATLNLQSDPKYLQALGLVQLKAIVDLSRSADFAAFNITTLFFAFGSTLFFWLFLQSRYIPRLLAGFGVFASLVALLTSLADLLLPAYAGVIQLGWIPTFMAEIATGIWLLVRGVRVEPAAD